MGCFTKNPPFRNSPRTYGIHFLIKIVYHKCGVFSIFRTILLYLSYFFFDFSLYQFGYQFTNLLPIICEMFCHFYSNIVIYKIFYPIFFYRLPLSVFLFQRCAMRGTRGIYWGALTVSFTLSSASVKYVRASSNVRTVLIFTYSLL